MTMIIIFVVGLFGAMLTSANETTARCDLPLEVGNCSALKTRYGYKDGKCVEFVYGGCGGNKNNFKTEEECEAACSPSVDACTLTPDSGLCLALFNKWAYANGQCKQFIWGGCGGNANRFDSKEQCEARCSPATVDECNLPKEVGRCRAAIPRWAYENGTCVPFIYGGCEGNLNRFETQEQCEARCMKKPVDRCSLKLETGRCKAALLRWGYKNGACSTFIYGGCEGNENNFKTQEECEKHCLPDACEQPLDSGPCYGRKVMWGYHKGRCIPFIYGGCQGNINRFSKKSDCEEKCNVTALGKPDKCSIDAMEGMRSSRGSKTCKTVTRWLYSVEINKCVKRRQKVCGKPIPGYRRKRTCQNKCTAKFRHR